MTPLLQFVGSIQRCWWSAQNWNDYSTSETMSIPCSFFSFFRQVFQMKSFQIHQMTYYSSDNRRLLILKTAQERPNFGESGNLRERHLLAAPPIVHGLKGCFLEILALSMHLVCHDIVDLVILGHNSWYLVLLCPPGPKCGHFSLDPDPDDPNIGDLSTFLERLVALCHG